MARTPKTVVVEDEGKAVEIKFLAVEKKIADYVISLIKANKVETKKNGLAGFKFYSGIWAKIEAYNKANNAKISLWDILKKMSQSGMVGMRKITYKTSQGVTKSTGLYFLPEDFTPTSGQSFDDLELS